MNRVQARILSLVIMLLSVSVPAHAQSTGTTLSEHVARLSVRASQLLPYLDYEVLSRIQAWVNGIAVAVAVLVLLFGFLGLLLAANNERRMVPRKRLTITNRRTRQQYRQADS